MDFVGESCVILEGFDGQREIDVEGFELQVVAGNDWRRFRPTVVLLEATRGQELVDVMATHGYRLEFFDGLNFYFVADEADGVSIHNYSERVLRANYRTMAEVDLAARWDHGAPGAVDKGAASKAPMSQVGPCGRAMPR